MEEESTRKEVPTKTKTGIKAHLGLLRAAITMLLIFSIFASPSLANSIPVNRLCPPTFAREQIAQMSSLLPLLSSKWKKSLKINMRSQFDLMNSRPIFRSPIKKKHYNIILQSSNCSDTTYIKTNMLHRIQEYRERYMENLSFPNGTQENQNLIDLELNRNVSSDT